MPVWEHGMPQDAGVGARDAGGSPGRSRRSAASSPVARGAEASKRTEGCVVLPCALCEFVAWVTAICGGILRHQQTQSFGVNQMKASSYL